MCHIDHETNVTLSILLPLFFFSICKAKMLYILSYDELKILNMMYVLTDTAGTLIGRHWKGCILWAWKQASSDTNCYSPFCVLSHMQEWPLSHEIFWNPRRHPASCNSHCCYFGDCISKTVFVSCTNWWGYGCDTNAGKDFSLLP